MPSAVPPIDAAQSAALSSARSAQRRLSFALKLAKWNGVTLLLAALITLVLAPFDPSLLLAAAALAGCGLFELEAGKRLRRHEPRALLWLAGNQLLLLTVVVVYAGLQLRAALFEPASLAAEFAKHPELAQVIASIDDPQLTEAIDGLGELYRTVQVSVYAVLIAVTMFVQGGAALYYLSRRKHLKEFLATPAWVVEHLKHET
ncbi:MAG TPA: hypothetical protein VJR89_37045 [Polyangiales bacterium]|nr:hypothetical protein [Polyangiales bacterium]